jgi:hypothetical protein
MSPEAIRGGEENNGGYVMQLSGLIRERMHRAAMAGDPAFRRRQQFCIDCRR